MVQAGYPSPKPLNRSPESARSDGHALMGNRGPCAGRPRGPASSTAWRGPRTPPWPPVRPAVPLPPLV